MDTELLLLAKRALNITWDEAETDLRLTDILEDAVPALRFKLGAPEEFDFSAPSPARKLLLAYCRYEYNGMAELFDDAYAQDLMTARMAFLLDTDWAKQEGSANDG